MRRQLPLLIEDTTDIPVDARLRYPDVRARLEFLMAGDLDFRGADTGYATHHLHSFAARFPPQLPRYFIETLTAPGDIVLDPMVGSGTTVLEAALLGRKGIGVDLDPLAVLISKAKTTPVSPEAVIDAGKRVLLRAHRSLGDGLNPGEVLYPDHATGDFVQYWFLPRTQQEVAALVQAICKEEDPAIRRLLLVVLSSTIVTKSGGVSLARDLAHSRPHRDTSKSVPDALELFQRRLRNAIPDIPVPQGLAIIVHADARFLPLPDQSVHLVVTSPPYANAIDYMRAHKFSLVWMGKSIRELSQWRARHIGSEKAHPAGININDLPPLARDVAKELSSRDSKKARILVRYFTEMRKVLQETWRVLCPGSAAIFVVGTSIIRGINVQTHLCLAEIATCIGFTLVGVTERRLDRDRRMMPARYGENRSLIEQRMHHEYVIGLIRPEER